MKSTFFEPLPKFEQTLNPFTNHFSEFSLLCSSFFLQHEKNFPDKILNVKKTDIKSLFTSLSHPHLQTSIQANFQNLHFDISNSLFIPLFQQNLSNFQRYIKFSNEEYLFKNINMKFSLSNLSDHPKELQTYLL
jgi:hypothetical protein